MIIDKIVSLLAEGYDKEKVVAAGRISKRQSSTKPGYKVVNNGSGDKEEVKMPLEEKILRAKTARKTALRQAHVRKIADKKRNKSIKYHEKLWHGKKEVDESIDINADFNLNKNYSTGMLRSGV